MALKIRPTPTLTGKAASRIFDAITKNSSAYTSLSLEEINAKKEAVNKVLSKAKL